jgi:hypothetical protein
MGHATLATTALYTKISSATAVATVQALPAPGHLRAVAELFAKVFHGIRKEVLTCDYFGFTR